ncbi:PRDM2 protein, partial [Polypterus senegalus]|nr:PRDM2 protein [Polypterus senegalus]
MDHRSVLHGVGKVFICTLCNKEFAFLCNLEQHQKDLHPEELCTHMELENGKLRPQNYTNPIQTILDPDPEISEEDEELNDSSEELYTTIKVMATGGDNSKGPDVRLGINQHYPSFKPPPFPYHNRTPAGSVASASNFTTRNIPQTFSTAIRCTKCGKSFDNMPELHKHILVCASASDRKRYTPKKNPVPLKQAVKPQNGLVSVAATAEVSSLGQNAFRRMGQPKKLNFNQEPSAKMKLSALNKKKNQLVQKAISQKNRAALTAKRSHEISTSHICPHCSREFTYIGSLNKHVTVSCPRKPVLSKKSKKTGSRGAQMSKEKSGNLRRKTADSEIKLQGSPNKLGKTRANHIGPVIKPAGHKTKVSSSQIRSKRHASFQPSTIPYAKKSRMLSKGSVQMVQSHFSLAVSNHMQQRGTKEVAQRKSTIPSLKKDHLPIKTRERSSGPVTRSTASSDIRGQDGNMQSDDREPVN